MNLTTSISRKYPLEIQDEIVGTLEDDKDALAALRLACGSLNTSSRGLLFQHIAIASVDRLLRLNVLLSSPLCSIPTRANTLTIHIQDRGNIEFDRMTVHDALLDVLEHFSLGATTLLSLDLPWLVSRGGGIWEYTRAHVNLRKFVLNGTYSWITDVAEALTYMTSLESLVVNASWKLDQILTRDGTQLPPNLKEIGLSESSLGLLGWMTATEGGPSSLHLICIKVDGVPSHHLSLAYLCPFLQRFGSRTRYLSFWFEECPDQLYEDLGNALQYAPRLSRLHLFFPSVFDEDDVVLFTGSICSKRMPPVTRTWDAFQIDDESEFWVA